jgi:hypothetical protein
MKGLAKISVIAAIFFLIASCNPPAPAEENPPPLPQAQIVPTLPIDLSGAQATLTVVRTMQTELGYVTITAALPLLFAIDDKNPEESAILWGTGTGIATLNGIAKGTGGSYTVEGDWPVDYEVRGVLTPSREVCRINLSVDEILLLSKEVVVHAGPLGDVPMSGGVDEFTTFTDLKFTEIDSSVTIGSGTVQSTFTIDDWCMPKSTYCTYGCTP